MTGDPKSDKVEATGSGTARNGEASPEADADLADQVERVVSLLHKLETLYAQTPPKGEAGRAGSSGDDGLGRDGPEDDFLERFAAGQADRYGQDMAAQPKPSRPEYRQPPPVPDRSQGQGADPALWYRGALRQHDRDLKTKPNLLTKIGLGVAGGLAVLLTLPWLVPAALGPDWRPWMAGGGTPSAVAPRERIAAPKVPAAAPKIVPVEKAVIERPQPGRLATNDAVEAGDPRGGEGDLGGPATHEVAAADAERPAETPPPAKAAVAPPPVENEASKEDSWRAAALQALLDQRTAWNQANTSGNWSGIAQTAPVDSRTFGEFDAPFSGAEAPAAGDSGSRMAALDDGATSSDATLAVADTCESALVESDQRSVRLSVVDPSRTGSQTELVVNDISYRAIFGEDGRLNLEVPRLDETPVVRWVQRDGSVCQRTVPRPAGPPSLQVAVMWSGELGLELDVVEPRSWPGSPTGFITSLSPNTDGSHGAGSIRGFGNPGDPNRSLMYAVATEGIGDRGVVNMQVKLSPRAEGGGTCGASAEVFTNAEILYEVFILHDEGPEGKFRRENKSFAFKVPPCGATAAHQRIERMSVRF